MPESGYAETTEEEHAHYCEMCGSVWVHEDESCVGPRWEGKMYWGSTWDCPRCAGDGR